MSTPDLNWLFSAHFADGTVLVQDQADTATTPEGKALQPNGSAFTDVRAALTKSPLAFFELHHVERDETVTVDLVTGAFAMNGIPFEAHVENFDPSLYQLELCYWRQVRAERTVGADDTVLSERHYVNRYYLGWSTTVDGVEKQVTIAVGGA